MKTTTRKASGTTKTPRRSPKAHARNSSTAKAKTVAVKATAAELAEPIAASRGEPAAVPVSEHSAERIELFPQGISVGTGLGRPVLILKDKQGIEVLPVWMSPIDAGLALNELANGTGVSPHSVIRQLLAGLEMQLESCVLEELVGHHQFVSLTFRGRDENVRRIRVRADESMSFCLQAAARFFSTKAFMARCRAVDADISQLEQQLAGQTPTNAESQAEISSKKHPYVM